MLRISQNQKKAICKNLYTQYVKTCTFETQNPLHLWLPFICLSAKGDEQLNGNASLWFPRDQHYTINALSNIYKAFNINTL